MVWSVVFVGAVDCVENITLVVRDVRAAVEADVDK